MAEIGGGEIHEICINPIAMLHEKVSSCPKFIFKVPRHLRQVNESAYEPRIISIGPYHWNKDYLKAKEMSKSKALEMLLKRRNEDSRESYEEAMRGLEHDVRQCYAEAFDRMSSKELVEMLVLDGCFIIELIRGFENEQLSAEGNDLLKRNYGQDLLLFENQLPFFVLEELFNMTKTPNDEDETLAVMALKFFSRIVPGPGIRELNNRRSDRRKRDEIEIKHLLGLVQATWLPSRRVKRYRGDRNWNFIRSARELLEIGIKFRKHSGCEVSLFDIKFKKRRFEIPTLRIDHDTDRIFRNLIAYEHQFYEGPTYVMDYARFMDSLINHADDVALLSKCGILVHCLGSDDDVARMFNKLNDGVYLKANFYYSEIFNEVNDLYRNRWIKWKVDLRNKYSHTPWDWVLLSIIAGVILLLLTMVQTVYAVLTYHTKGS